jgi:hypothetical protein
VDVPMLRQRCGVNFYDRPDHYELVVRPQLRNVVEQLYVEPLIMTPQKPMRGCAIFF